MRKSLCAIGGVIGIFVLAAMPAFAADMAVKAPPAPLASLATNWSGFYVGGNVGGGIATGEFLDPCESCADIQINEPSFTVGGQAGYNWQRGALVYGLEGDFNWISADKTLPFAQGDGSCSSGCTATLKMDAVASIRGRMGLAYDSALFYVTAGPAFGHFNSAVHLNDPRRSGAPVTSTDDVWLPGVAAGFGVEYMLTSNLSVRGEFLYELFKDSNTNYLLNATGLAEQCASNNAPCGINYTYSAALVRLGLNWKFGTDPGSYATTVGASGPSTLAFKAPRLAAAAAAADWSGFYVGGNAGGGVVTGEFLDPCFSCGDLKINDPAFTAGGQAGYNWQRGAFVYGLEGDFNWVSADRSLPNTPNFNGCPGVCTATLKMDAFASVRGRMGLAYDSALVYVTAGPAFGHFNSSVSTVSPPVTSTDNVWLPGIAAGAGVEYMLTNNLSIRGEVLYLLFKDSNTNYIVNATGLPTTNCAGNPSCGINYTYSAAIARLGLDWKLGAAPGSTIYKAPAAPPANWAGLYAGLNAGGGIASGKFLDPCQSCADIAINDPAFAAGGQLGYNWQHGAFVYGLEGDLNWISADRSLPYAQSDSGCPAPAPSCTATLKMDAYGSVRGRMGFAYDSALVYVTGGPAFGHFNSAVHYNNSGNGGPTPLTSTDNVWLPGVAAGVGVEYMLTSNLSIRGEVLYLAFRDSNTNYIVNATGLPAGPALCSGNPSCGINYTYTAEIARLGANWKFN